MRATAAIYHHPDVIERESTPLAGRRAAGQSFLVGYARHVEAERLHCAADAPAVARDFAALMRAAGWTGPIESAMAHDPRRLGEPGTLMVPGPNLAAYAWVRRRVDQRHYAICGITHTVSTRRISEGLFDLLSGPVEDWDAIICTSRAVHDVVRTQLEEGARYLARRFGARRVPLPMLPVIPLGIDTERFARDPARRAAIRRRLGLADDDVVLMSMGRLSVFEKMHPLPLFLAVQEVARRTGRRPVLLMAGWFGDDGQKTLHSEAAAAAAPDVDVRFPDGKDPELREGLWSAADIFVLPVDNVQETFGLAPVEAMAAGLPVVCSDWNGFKDTVVHGETGYRIRTWASSPGSGVEIANRFRDDRDKYLQYLGFVHQRTAVDVREMADALAALVEDPARRARMGEAGVRRARRMYDWSAVIPQYQSLWQEQTERRLRGIPSSPRLPREPTDPTAIDPFVLYAGYPTDRLPVSARLSTGMTLTVDDVETLFERSGAVMIRRFVASADALVRLHELVRSEGPLPLADLPARLSIGAPQCEAAVLWLAKFDCLRIEV